MCLRRVFASLCIVAACSVAADAGTIKGLIGSLDPFQQWSDNSGDFLVDFDNGGAQVDAIGGGALPAKSAGHLDVGDILVGQFSINSIEELALANGEIPVPGAVGQEFTGAFAIEVVGKTILGPEQFNWVFSPVMAGKIASLPAAVAAEVVTWAAGTMAVFYQDSSLDYTRLSGDATIDSAFSTAVNGTRLFEMGFTGGAGEGWTAGAITDDISVIGAIPPPGNGGGFNASVNKTAGDPQIIFNPQASLVVPGQMVDMNASGSLLGTRGVNTPYDSFNNVDFVVNVEVVPEPSTMAIWTLIGVAGVVGHRRKKNKKNS